MFVVHVFHLNVIYLFICLISYVMASTFTYLSFVSEKSCFFHHLAWTMAYTTIPRCHCYGEEASNMSIHSPTSQLTKYYQFE